ncbi:MAG: hypothetical protein EHM42_00445 [Planctomycetaceae bacterium]|nr:MAG: hypothetical protein EHM42_00445 [Planctomycetaceae bacterium]
MPDAFRDSSAGRRGPPQGSPLPYVRTTITIPGELKGRMERIGDRVNWSAIASKAFEAHLSQVSPLEPPMPELPDKDDAIARLKNLKNQPEHAAQRMASRSYQLGKRWAMADAHPNELGRLETFCRRSAIDRPVDQWKVDIHERGAFKRLFREMTLSILGYDQLTDPEVLRREFKPFWEQRVGISLEASDRSEMPDPLFVSEFAQGSLDFWREIKGQL